MCWKLNEKTNTHVYSASFVKKFKSEKDMEEFQEKLKEFLDNIVLFDSDFCVERDLK